VLHGDAHVGNVFIDRTVDPGRLGLFDWGLMTVGSPMRDVSYFITMTLDPATRAAHERELLDAYLAARRSLGATEIPADVAWLWHRVQSAYTVVASCQSIVVPAAASDRRRAFSAAFLRRAIAAVEDLDPIEALGSLG
jgi:aminoglycoside phosphotransferase (APT) family kinase protein